jgi:TetR/AcrR family transcriptional regulator, transcriptional repressor for nem operon
VTTGAGRIPHRERMLRAGNTLFYDRGYHGTSVDALLAEAGSPKGSFYHHFGGKDGFGHAVLDVYAASRQRLLDHWVERTDLGVVERVTGYHQDLVERFDRSGWQRACLAGKLSNEVAGSSEEFRRHLAETFRRTRDVLVGLLVDGQGRGEVTRAQDPAALADAVQALIQGGFVVALALREREPLDHVTTALDDLLRNT